MGIVRPLVHEKRAHFRYFWRLGRLERTLRVLLDLLTVLGVLWES